VLTTQHHKYWAVPCTSCASLPGCRR